MSRSRSTLVLAALREDGPFEAFLTWDDAAADLDLVVTAEYGTLLSFGGASTARHEPR